MSAKKRPKMTPEQRAAKQARDRAYRARKVAKARAEGRPLREAYGHAQAARPRRTVRGPGGEVVHRTGSKEVMLRILREAAANGQKVAIRGTFATAAGPRHVTLDGHTPQQRHAIESLS